MQTRGISYGRENMVVKSLLLLLLIPLLILLLLLLVLLLLVGIIILITTILIKVFITLRLPPWILKMSLIDFFPIQIQRVSQTGNGYIVDKIQLLSGF